MRTLQYIFSVVMYDNMTCSYRKIKIHLQCDESVPIDSPDFKFDNEDTFFLYVRVS